MEVDTKFLKMQILYQCKFYLLYILIWIIMYKINIMTELYQEAWHLISFRWETTYFIKI